MKTLTTMVILLSLVFWAMMAAKAGERHDKDDRVLHHFTYQPVSLAVAHGDQQLTTMLERMNAAGDAASHGDYPTMTSLVLGNDKDDASQVSHVEIKLSVKGKHLAHIEIRNMETAALIRLNFRTNGTASQYVEANVDKSTKGLMRIMSIRDNGVPEGMTTGNTEMKPQGRQVRWNAEGIIESDKMLP